MPIDVALIHTSLPDEHGFLSLGAECVSSLAAVESAKTVVAQVNEKMPRTLGNTFVHFSRVARIVEVSEDLLELTPELPGPVEERIGAFMPGWWKTGRRCRRVSAGSLTPP